MSDRPSIHLIQTKRDPILAPNGSGPHAPTMEMRLTRLETDFQAMRPDLSATRSDTSYIRGRLESLPSTWQMVGTILAGNVGLAGVFFAALQLSTH